MYFKYDKSRSIEVPYPFSRIMTPFMTSDSATGKIDFSVHMTEWLPGTKVDDHKHDDATEVMFCISGHGKASVNGVEYDFCPDSMIAALPGEMHQIINTGDELLRVVCVFSPPVSAKGLKERADKAVEEYRKAQSGR